MIEIIFGASGTYILIGQGERRNHLRLPAEEGAHFQNPLEIYRKALLSAEGENLEDWAREILTRHAGFLF
jgi:hypothetical protein